MKCPSTEACSIFWADGRYVCLRPRARTHILVDELGLQEEANGSDIPVEPEGPGIDATNAPMSANEARQDRRCEAMLNYMSVD